MSMGGSSSAIPPKRLKGWFLILTGLLATAAMVLIEMRWQIGAALLRYAGHAADGGAYHNTMLLNFVVVMAPLSFVFVLVIVPFLLWRRLRPYEFVLSIIVGIVLAVAWMAEDGRKFHGDPFLEGLAERVNEAGCVDQWRAWAVAHPKFEDYQQLEGLPPAHVTVSPDGLLLNIRFGGGFLPIWGVTVTTPGESCEPLKKDSVKQVGDGVWVWFNRD
jgi:hypothetical protein